jgi:hypothetical protein
MANARAFAGTGAVPGGVRGQTIARVRGPGALRGAGLDDRVTPVTNRSAGRSEKDFEFVSRKRMRKRLYRS